MDHPILTFFVRTYDTAPLSEMAARVARALNLSFSPARSSKWEETEALEAHALGIGIHLYAWPLPEEGEKTRYNLRGYAERDVALESTHLVNVSECIALVLNMRDSGEWYVPDLAEVKRDLMLDDDTPSEDQGEADEIG